MTNNEMKQQIELMATAARSSGQTVKINRKVIDWVDVHRGDDDDYFFQGEEASELIRTAEDVADRFDVSREDYILWSAQGW